MLALIRFTGIRRNGSRCNHPEKEVFLVDSDQKFTRSMVLISFTFATVVTLGAVALGYLLGKPDGGGDTGS